MLKLYTASADGFFLCNFKHIISLEEPNTIRKSSEIRYLKMEKNERGYSAVHKYDEYWPAKSVNMILSG